MRIAVVGTGYVGLVTGTCFAESGNQVICVDIDQQKVEQLRAGQTPIYEPGLENLLHRNIKLDRLHFTTSLEEAVKDAQIIFLALPTPPGKDGSADLQYVLGVAQDLTKIITDFKIIVNKSTVPVGTGEQVEAVLSKGLDRNLFEVVSNPEFLREGVAVEDFMKPDRVVIGTSSSKAQKLMEELYQPFTRQGNPIYVMDIRSAEMTKYAANAYLAMRISYMNEMANLCERTGANVDWVRIGMGSDSRIGKRFLFPGVGYGGSCFPKDVSALAQTARSHNYVFQLIETVLEVNAFQKKVIVDKIVARFGEDLTGKTIAIWGLAFKPETDDIRDAPSLEIITALLSRGAAINTFDPEAMNNVQKIFGDKVGYATDQYAALEGADALVIVTEWNEFRNPDFEKVSQLMPSQLIFDGRNVFAMNKMEELGYTYFSMGRPAVIPNTTN